MLLFDMPFTSGEFGLVEWIIIGVLALIVVLALLVFVFPKKDNKEVEVKELINEKEVSNEPEVNETTKPVMKEPEVKDTPKEPVSKPNTVQKESLDYHVNYYEDADPSLDGKWRVVREGSQRALKYFRTQKEAIDYANVIARNQNVGVIVYRKDGQIRKV